MEYAQRRLYDSMTLVEKLQYAHDRTVADGGSEINQIWQRIEKGFANLQTMEIDFTNADCPNECRGMAELPWSNLTQTSLKKLRIIGLRSEA